MKKVTTVLLDRTYNSIWAEAQEELATILEKDQELQGTYHQDVSHPWLTFTEFNVHTAVITTDIGL